MTVNEIGKYSRPVLFETEIEGSESLYSMIGSCFSIESQSGYYIITAKHVVSGYTPEQIRVPYWGGSSEFLPFCRTSQFSKYPDGEDHKFDVVVYKLDLSALNCSEFQQNLFVKAGTIIEDYSTFDSMIISGFPSLLNKIDYDRHKIKNQRLTVTCKYAGRGDIEGFHSIIFDDTPEVNDFNGLSGSPVFGLKKIKDTYALQLLGVLVRATWSSGKGHFIPFSIISHLLKHNNLIIRTKNTSVQTRKQNPIAVTDRTGRGCD